MSSNASKHPQTSVDDIYQNLLEAFEAVDEAQRMEFAIMVIISLCDQVRENEKISEILHICQQALEKED